VPVPEHAALQTMVPKDALGDAYEAILEAMEEETVEEEVEEEARSNTAPEKTISEEEKKIDSLEDSESTENEVVILDSAEEPNEITVQTPVEKVTELPAEKRKPSNENKSVEVAVEIEPKISDAPVPNTVYKNIVEFLRSINLNDYADDMELNGGDSLPNVRRGLAKHVGVTPRDTRIDRMLRLALRLLPQNNEFDEKKSELLALMAGNVKTMQRWMRARLEHRHSGSSDHFLEDARQLGVALKRIPGPGYPVPLVADDYDLPNANDIKALESEVRRLIRHLNLPTAGGITA